MEQRLWAFEDGNNILIGAVDMRVSYPQHNDHYVEWSLVNNATGKEVEPDIFIRWQKIWVVPSDFEGTVILKQVRDDSGEQIVPYHLEEILGDNPVKMQDNIICFLAKGCGFSSLRTLIPPYKK